MSRHDHLARAVLILAMLALAVGVNALNFIAIPAEAGSDPVCYDQTASQWRALGYRVVIGTPNKETLSGTTGNDVLIGLGGDDTLNGNGGDDVLCGGDGNDTLHGGPGNDVLDGGAGNDLLDGADGADILVGGEGNDKLYGGGGLDILIGDCLTHLDEVACETSGADYIDGGVAIDFAIGDSAMQTQYPERERPPLPPQASYFFCGTCYDDPPDDGTASFLGSRWVLYGDGNDQIFLRAGAGGEILNRAEWAYGVGGNDLLDGADGDEYLFGGDGDDTILGGPGNDYLVGGAGDDNCNGGPAQNTVDPKTGTRTDDQAFTCETVVDVP